MLLKEKRQVRGIPQNDLAVRVGVKTKAVRSWRSFIPTSVRKRTKFRCTRQRSDSAVNAAKIKYSRVKIKASGRLKPEMVKQVEWIRKLFKPAETIEVFDFADIAEEE